MWDIQQTKMILKWLFTVCVSSDKLYGQNVWLCFNSAGHKTFSVGQCPMSSDSHFDCCKDVSLTKVILKSPTIHVHSNSEIWFSKKL